MTVPTLRAHEASRLRPTARPQSTTDRPGLSRTSTGVGVVDTGIWLALALGYTIDPNQTPGEHLFALLAMAIGGGVLFLLLAIRDLRIVEQGTAAFRLGRMSVMLERAAAAAKSRPSRRPGRTPAAPAPSAPTRRTDEASEDSSTR
jgi:hypothetical protein